MTKGGSRSKAGGGGGATADVASKSEQIPDSPEAIAQVTGLSADDASKAYDSIRAFAGIAYSDIRDYEAFGKGGSQAKQHAENINKYLDRAPVYDGEMFRGFAFSSKSRFDDFMKGVSSKKMEVNAMSSFTKSRKIAEQFAGGGLGDAEYQVVMRVRKSKPVGADISKISKLTEEEEVLVKKGSRFKIEDVKRSVTDSGIVRVEIIASH